jgi:hypothetical protein
VEVWDATGKSTMRLGLEVLMATSVSQQENQQGTLTAAGVRVHESNRGCIEWCEMRSLPLSNQTQLFRLSPKANVPSEVTLIVYLDTERPLSEPKWVLSRVRKDGLCVSVVRVHMAI